MFLPSVLGVEEASLPSPFLMESRTTVLTFFFQIIFPSVDAHQSMRSLPSAPVRKMRSPQMIGVELPLPGSVSFQARFLVSLNAAGRFFSLEMPLLSGPRHWGQLSARPTATRK